MLRLTMRALVRLARTLVVVVVVVVDETLRLTRAAETLRRRRSQARASVPLEYEYSWRLAVKMRAPDVSAKLLNFVAGATARFQNVSAFQAPMVAFLKSLHGVTVASSGACEMQK